MIVLRRKDFQKFEPLKNSTLEVAFLSALLVLQTFYYFACKMCSGRCRFNFVAEKDFFSLITTNQIMSRKPIQLVSMIH